MDIVILLILIILIIFDSALQEEWGTKESTNLLMGISAFIVLFHHISQRLSGFFFQHTGYLAVTLFFFLSGYGIYYSYMTHENYEKQIIVRKIPRILRYCLFTLCLMTFYFLIVEPPVKFSEIVSVYRGNRLLNWYFISMLIKYVFFVVSCTLTKGNVKKMLCINFLLISIYMAVVFLADFGAHWYISSYGFILGGIFAVYRETLQKFENSKCCLCLVCILFWGLFYLLKFSKWNAEKVGFIALLWLFLYILSGVSFCMMLFMMLGKRKSRFLFGFMGKNSAQMILLQEIALTIGRNRFFYIENDVLWTLSVVFVLLVLVTTRGKLYKRL